MALQMSVEVRNGANDAREATTGSAPIIRFYTGAPPANTATAATGTLIAQGTLPADWLTASATGLKSKNGTWTATGLPAAGTGAAAGYFRISIAADTRVDWQGSVSATGGGGDMTLDNTSIANNQVATINSFNITEPNG